MDSTCLLSTTAAWGSEAPASLLAGNGASPQGRTALQGLQIQLLHLVPELHGQAEQMGTRPTFIPSCCQVQSWTTEPQHWLVPLLPALSAIPLFARSRQNISPLALPCCWSFLLKGRGRRQRQLEPKRSPEGTELNAGHMLVVLALQPLTCRLPTDSTETGT